MMKQDQSAGAELRRENWLTLAVGVGVALVGWVVWGAAALFKKDLLRQAGEPNEFTCQIYLYMAVGVSVLAMGVVAKRWRRSGNLLKRGVRVEGRVVEVSGLSDGIKRPVTFAFLVGGLEHRARRDVLEDYAANFDESTRVQMIYDPNDPDICEVLDYGQIPDSTETMGEAIGEGIKRGLGENVKKAVMGVLLVGNMVLFHTAARAMGVNVRDWTWLVSIVLASMSLWVVEQMIWAAWTEGEGMQFAGARRLRKIVLGVLLVATLGMGGWATMEDREEAKRSRKGNEIREMMRQNEVKMPRGSLPASRRGQGG